jgi:hypothetical protein
LVKLDEKRVCLSDYGTSIDYGTEVITDPSKIKMGWHYSRLGCRTQKEFAELYNLWNLEIRVRMLLRSTSRNALHIVKEDGAEYVFTQFDNIPDAIRTRLDTTCAIKPPRIN